MAYDGNGKRALAPAQQYDPYAAATTDDFATANAPKRHRADDHNPSAGAATAAGVSHDQGLMHDAPGMNVGGDDTGSGRDAGYQVCVIRTLARDETSSSSASLSSL